MKSEGYVFAMICSSNVNRSMAAHDLLKVGLCLPFSLLEEQLPCGIIWYRKRSQNAWFGSWKGSFVAFSPFY